MQARLPFREVELEKLGISFEIGILEPLLLLEEDVLHLPELSLLAGCECRARRGLGPLVERQHEGLVYDSNSAGVGGEKGVQPGHDLPAVRALEVGDIDDRDRRMVRALGRRSVDGDGLEG
jgi:hypothetical protein